MTVADAVDSNGFSLVKFGEDERYVTRDDKGRALVGPRVHRKKGWRLFRNRRGNRPSNIVANSNDETIIIDTEGARPVRTWRDKVRAKFYDNEFHKAVQNLGVDIMIWAIGLSVAAVFVKGAVWVVTL